jgi:hypothetical protein
MAFLIARPFIRNSFLAMFSQKTSDICTVLFVSRLTTVCLRLHTLAVSSLAVWTILQWAHEKLTNQLTPWDRVLPEKLVTHRLIKIEGNFGIRIFVNILTTTRSLYLS